MAKKSIRPSFKDLQDKDNLSRLKIADSKPYNPVDFVYKSVSFDGINTDYPENFGVSKSYGCESWPDDLCFVRKFKSSEIPQPMEVAQFDDDAGLDLVSVKGRPRELVMWFALDLIERWMIKGGHSTVKETNGKGVVVVVFHDDVLRLFALGRKLLTEGASPDDRAEIRKRFDIWSYAYSQHELFRDRSPANIYWALAYVIESIVSWSQGHLRYGLECLRQLTNGADEDRRPSNHKIDVTRFVGDGVTSEFHLGEHLASQFMSFTDVLVDGDGKFYDEDFQVESVDGGISIRFFLPPRMGADIELHWMRFDQSQEVDPDLWCAWMQEHLAYLDRMWSFGDRVTHLIYDHHPIADKEGDDDYPFNWLTTDIDDA